jgi:hypothetical protein
VQVNLAVNATLLQFCSDIQNLLLLSLMFVARETCDARAGLIGPLYSLVLHQHSSAREQVKLAPPTFHPRHPTFVRQLQQHVEQRGDPVRMTVTDRLHVSCRFSAVPLPFITRVSRDAFAQDAIVFRLLLNRPYISNYAQVFIPPLIRIGSVACATRCDT